MKRFGWMMVLMVFLSGLALSGLAQADPIAVQYNFEGFSSGSTSAAPPNNVGTGYNATNLARNPLGTGNIGIATNGGTALGTYAGTRFENSRTEQNAIDNQDFFTFTLDAGTGNALNLTSFSYSVQRTSTGPDTTFVRSSLDSFATNLAGSAVGAVPTTGFLNLSSPLDPAFLTTTVPVEFRIYFYGANTNPGTSGRATIDNVTVTAVPEPGTVALMMVGLAAIAFLSWKKREPSGNRGVSALLSA